MGEVVDSSGAGNHGVAHGGVTPTQDLWGSYAAFDGVDDYVEVPNSRSLQVDGDLTISLWFKPRGGDSGWLVEKSRWDEFGVYMEENSFLWFHQRGMTWPFLHQGGLVMGRWHHLVLSRNAATKQVSAFLNGVQVSATEYGWDPGSQPMASEAPLRIGSGHDGDALGWAVDQVEIYNRVWVTNDVLAEYDGDGDGMVTPWEQANGLAPDVNDAGDDTDGDGYSNYAEYANGTDPQDAGSHP